MAVLRGNLAPGSAVIKLGGHPGAAAAHRPRRGVRSLDDMAARIDDPRSTSRPTTCWCCATPARWARPACRKPATSRSRRSSRAQGVKDMVRISDARMSGTAFGTIVLHVSPEAAAGGPLALVRRRRPHPPRRRRAAGSTCWSTTPSWRAPAPGAWRPRRRARERRRSRLRAPLSRGAAGRRGLRLRLPGLAGAAQRRTQAGRRRRPGRRRASPRGPATRSPMAEPTPPTSARFIADKLACEHLEVEADGGHFFATIVSPLRSARRVADTSGSTVPSATACARRSTPCR